MIGSWRGSAAPYGGVARCRGEVRGRAVKWWCGAVGDAEERPSSGVEERVTSATDLVAWRLTRTLRVAAEGKSDRERDM